MRSTCLRYPKRSKFIQIHEWQLEATGGNQPAAALLSVLEYRHNYLLDNKEYDSAVRAALRSQKKELSPDFKAWQFYTDEELESLLLLWKKEAILKARDLLHDKKYIEIFPPEELQKLFKTGRRKWFKFRADIVNRFLDDFNAKIYGAYSGAPEESAVKTSELTAEQFHETFGTTLTAAARAVFDDWKTVLDSPQSVLDSKRLDLAIARLKQGYTAERLMLASRGVCFLDHNMGDNDKRQQYYSFELLFRDAAHVEQYEAAALAAGLTVENFREFEISRKKRQLRKKEAAPEIVENEASTTAYLEVARAFAEGIAYHADRDDILNNAAAAVRAGERFRRDFLATKTLEAIAALTVVDQSTRRRMEALLLKFFEN